MKADAQIINGYWGLLRNLTRGIKLKLIERLSKSVGEDITTKNDQFENSYGAWVDSRDADEIIMDIRNSRTFYREIESF